jgi:F-type H+-transporting ATPase subunit a
VPKKGCLGCTFPVLIVIAVLFIALLIIGFIAGPIGTELVGDIGLPEWISVAKPHPELPVETLFNAGGFPLITNSFIATWLTIIVLVGLSYAATRKMKLVPKGVQNLMEYIVDALLSFCNSVAGEKNGRKFFPIVATIFLFVLFNAWLSLLPGFGSILVHMHGHEIHLLRGANTDANTPLAIAIMSFVFVTYFGVRMAGKVFFKTFFDFGQFGRGFAELFTGKLKSGLMSIFFGAIDIFVGFLELLSYFIRLISFTFRLFGNMTAGEILLLIVVFLVPWLAVLPFYALELLVGFVQALIFAGLTLVFLTMAVAHHGDESEHTEETEHND